jgi:hypothetical protein
VAETNIIVNIFKEVYRRKLISAVDASGLVKSGMTVNPGESTNLATLIDCHLAEGKDYLFDRTNYGQRKNVTLFSDRKRCH